MASLGAFISFYISLLPHLDLSQSKPTMSRLEIFYAIQAITLRSFRGDLQRG